MPDPARRARDAFLHRYQADLERGGPRPLGAYQAEAPGFEEEVAEEYRLLEEEGAVGGAESAADPEGSTLGPYSIVRELGRGGQAVVYLAVDRRLGREVALKVLRSGAFDLASPDDLRRFRREAEVSARLEHPGICSVYEAGEAEGLPYIAMRYVRGDTLAQRIARSREQGMQSVTLLPGAAPEGSGSDRRGELDALLQVFEACARALHFAHELGLVHRDVKPGNVMLTESGEPVLLDFGLARLETDEHSLTASGVLLGTPYYMAPEQVRGESDRIDRRTDVYALGVSLYEATTLQRPFEAASREALYRQILIQEPRPARQSNPRLPRDLEVVLEAAMAKERARRYPSALALAEDLGRVRRREPIVARPAGPLLRLWRWAQRRPAVAALSAVLLSTVVVSAVLLLRNNALLAEKVAEFTRLSDLQLVESVSNRTLSLPAAQPGHLERWEDWHESVRGLQDRRPLHEATLARLEAAEEPDEAWQLGMLRRLLGKLDRFEDRYLDVGLRCMEHVRTVAQRSLEDARGEWDRAIEAIADPDECPAYQGLRIRPQMGLVPLGPDPRTGLWEFAHLASGAVPERDGEGVLQRDADTGIVLVLLTGGDTVMGARQPGPEREAGPHIDPFCRENESPLEIPLPPFFLSKYEITQAQWWWLTGGNPSSIDRGPRDRSLGEHPTWPLESVDHYQALSTMNRFGLDLPSEAQWEYGARAGSTTVWWHGDDPERVPRFDNVLDRRHLDLLEDVPEGLRELEWDDGFALLAPVGSYRANGFGLHDVGGNVAEFVRDEFLDRDGEYRIIPHSGQIARPTDAPDNKQRVLKGGSFASRFPETRSAFRYSIAQTAPANTVGLRPARPLSK